MHTEMIIDLLARNFSYQIFFTNSSRGSNSNAVVFISPSMTAMPNVFPSLRLYHYDSDSKELQDWEQFYFDPYAAEDAGEITWSKLYSALSYWGITDLSAASWLDLAVEMQTDCDLFNKRWLLFNQGNAEAPGCECGEECMTESICALLSSTWEEYKSCTE